MRDSWSPDEESDEKPEEEYTSSPCWEFYIAGVQFHELHTVLAEIQEGDYLNMVLEPTNKYDGNAVRLEWYDQHEPPEAVMLGYVPMKKNFSAEVTAAITINEKVTCKVIHFDPTAKKWEQCRVRVEVENV